MLATPINPATNKQLGDFARALSSALTKGGPPQASVVDAVMTQGPLMEDLADMVLENLQDRLKLIACPVAVNRKRSFKDALIATGRRTDVVDDSLVATMPEGNGDKVQLFFLPIGFNAVDSVVDQYLASHRFKAADPKSVAAVFEVDRNFANGYRIATHWKNSDDDWCYCVFDESNGVRVGLINSSWKDEELWACVRI